MNYHRQYQDCASAAQPIESKHVADLANAFCGPEKTLRAEVLARGGPPRYPTIRPSQERYAAAHAEYEKKILYYAKIY